VQHVEIKRRIAAPRQAVWDRYTDHVSWSEWAGLGKVRLDREGVPRPNGVGCVRVITANGVSVHEEVLTFESPRRMTYRVVKGGLPMKDHLGEVEFADDDGGTLVTWRCRFNSKIPGFGFIFRLIVIKVFRDALEGLSREEFERT